MGNTITINNMKAGQTAIIRKIGTKGDMRRRFIDLGLIEGTKIQCVGKSPLGDPTAFLIRGAVIAIRREDSSGILAELDCDGGELDGTY